MGIGWIKAAWLEGLGKQQFSGLDAPARVYTALWLCIWPMKKPEAGKLLPNEAEEPSVN